MIYPIIMPIFHSNPGSGAEYMYPHWVGVFLMVSAAITFISIVAALIVIAMDLLTDRFDPFEKPFIYAFVGVIVGAALLMVCAFFMLMTGKPITE